MRHKLQFVQKGIENGKVYFNDLYLDIVHLPTRDTLLIDEDDSILKKEYSIS